MSKLKDIKDIVELQIDYFPYIILVTIIIFLVTIIFLIIWYQKQKNITKKQQIRRFLKKYDFNKDAKTIAYDFTILAKEVIDKKDLDEYSKIVKELEQFKYKKVVKKELPNHLIDEIKEFIRVRV